MPEPQLTSNEAARWWAQFQAPLLVGVPQDAQDAMRMRNEELAQGDPDLRRKIRNALQSDWARVLVDVEVALKTGREPEDVQAERHARERKGRGLD